MSLVIGKTLPSMGFHDGGVMQDLFSSSYIHRDRMLGIREKTLAEVLGERVVRPLIDKSLFMGRSFVDFVSQSARYIDKKFSQAVQIFPGAEAVHVGTVFAFASYEIPEGCLMCEGQAVKKSEYPELFKALGGLYGHNDLEGTFNLPDYRGDYLRGATLDLKVGTKQDQSTKMPKTPFTLSVEGEHIHSAGLAGAHGHSLSNNGEHTHPMSIAGEHTHGMTRSGDHQHLLPQDIAGTQTDLQSLMSSPEADEGLKNQWSGPGGDHDHSISSAPGHVHSMDISGSHSHTVGINGLHEHSIGVNGSHTHNIFGGDNETRPETAVVAYAIQARPVVVECVATPAHTPSQNPTALSFVWNGLISLGISLTVSAIFQKYINKTSMQKGGHSSTEMQSRSNIQQGQWEFEATDAIPVVVPVEGRQQGAGHSVRVHSAVPRDQEI